MQKLNGLIFSDLHLFPHGGKYSRVDDGVEALDWVGEIYQKNNCNHLFFLGDWSHDKSKTHNVVISRTREILTHWRDDLKMRMTFIPGNHDCPHKTDPRDALPYLEEFGEVIRQPLTYFYDDVEVLCVPWAGPHERTWKVIKDSAAAMRNHSQHDEARQTLFLGHLDLVGAQMTNSSMSPNGLNPTQIGRLFDFTVLGHYHIMHDVVTNVWYVGSLLSTRFDEEGDRGVIHYSGCIANPIMNTISPSHMKLRPGLLSDETCLNNYVRILTTPLDNPVELRIKAIEMGARTARCIPDTAVPSDGDNAGVTLDQSACQMSDEELLDKWIEKMAPKDVDPDALRREGRRLIQKSREEDGHSVK